MNLDGWKFFGVRQGKRESDDPRRDIKLLRLTGRAEQRLAEVFQEEVERFINRQRCVFVSNPLRQPDRQTQVFVVESFPFPPAFSQAVREWQTWEDLEPAEINPDNVKAVLGVYIENDVVMFAAFKKLDRSKVLDQETVWLSWDRDTLDVPDGPAVTLPEGLCAVYSEGSLFFDNYQTTNGLLDLTPYFRESTTEEIDALFDAGPIKWEGERTVHDTVSQRCKRLMYLFNKGGGFSNERLTPSNIREHAAVVNLDVELKSDENGESYVVAPKTSGDLTRFFKLLTNHYYPGIWDDVWRETDAMHVVPTAQSSSSA